MKNLFRTAALATAMACYSSSSFAVIANNGLLNGTLDGSGCVIGNGEYGVSVFSMAPNPDSMVHGIKTPGTVVTHSATLTVVANTIPSQCNGVNVDIVVAPVSVVETNITELSFTNDAPAVPTAIGNVQPITVTWKGTVGANANNDLLDVFSYIKKFSVSVKASATQPTLAPE